VWLDRWTKARLLQKALTHTDLDTLAAAIAIVKLLALGSGVLSKRGAERAAAHAAA